MRIIAGEFRHRTLQSPPDGASTRPIPDRVKESIFNLLRGHFEGATVFDAFAGVGSIGLEAVSRGATRVVMVEQDRRVAAILERNATSLGAGDRAEVVVGDALGAGALARCPRPVHIAFFDPPYELVRDRHGYARVRAQFEACVALLDDTGFALLRTPWPFKHEEEVQPTAADVQRAAELIAPRPRREKAKRRGSRWMSELDGMERSGQTPDPFDLDVDRSDDEDHDENEAAELLTPRPKTFDVDLTMKGAAGPETHQYGSTAVHLYMRRRDA